MLLHGSGGLRTGVVSRWEWALRPLGVATFTLDSFSARGVVDHASDPSQLGVLARIYDLYRAADVLAADPRIDPDGIAVMGFSMGGIATLYGPSGGYDEVAVADAKAAVTALLRQIFALP